MPERRYIVVEKEGGRAAQLAQGDLNWLLDKVEDYGSACWEAGSRGSLEGMRGAWDALSSSLGIGPVTEPFVVEVEP